ncbi:MAG: hypothetical protein AB7D92_09285 [Sphaerochaeta sp.]
MIHDTLDHLHFYAATIANLEQVHALLEPGAQIAGGKLYYTNRVTSPFNGTFLMHSSKVCVLLTLEGSQLLCTTYRRKDREGHVDEKGFLDVADSAVTDVIRSEDQTFTVFMPGEPFASGIQGEEGPSSVKQLLILLDEV